MRRPRLTDKEWESVITALLFVSDGEDPWLEPDEEGPSQTLKAVRAVLKKYQW